MRRWKEGKMKTEEEGVQGRESTAAFHSEREPMVMLVKTNAHI